ncbi:histone-lysine N-methyltransferase eggless [Ceratina calcarata]|uniref:Histone-lysine N-methyltransferase eggless n=1 Tax=Ceratina calcarata TaxID=156304 RepID=A0AAJ7NE00_9HYME|nr:histone-lysine N-methyltransferase eggless [Ceratina calcarata]XP_026674603.1 histone-lysine N-methyltransferase eggless [Ceratina calcarata]
MEVIELVSDDEASVEKTKKNKDPLACNVNCINFQCSSGVDMKLASSFACVFYGVNMKKKKKRMICTECFNAALEHQKQLVAAFLDHKPLLKCNFPDRTNEVEISDSDDSDDEKRKSTCDEEKYLPEEMVETIGELLDSTVDSIFKKYDIDYQIKESHNILKDQWSRMEEENKALDKTVESLMSTMDTLRNRFYDEFKPQIQMLQELQIDDGCMNNTLHPLVATKKVTQVKVAPSVDSQPEVLPIEQENRQIVVIDLPPIGPLVKVQIEVDSIVYIMKHPLMPWIKGKVQTVVSKTPVHCRVKLLPKKYNSVVKSVSGKQIAAAVVSPVIIPIGTRVIAMFKDMNSSNFYCGVIAEPPKATNKYRYLIFFDDGYAQYVEHKLIYLVAESASKVWEDIPTESREFVKKYIEMYPERPMVKLQRGQVVRTEWNGKWWIARVVQVDASLVQMHFDADGRTEWIYRGSARLGPLYVELLKANARQHGHHASVGTPSRHRLPVASNKSNLPYVEYTSNVEPEDERLHEEEKEESPASESMPSAPQQSRAVARKSTTKRQPVPDTTSYNPLAETKPSHSIVYYQTQNKIQTKKFVPHKCGPQCVEGISFTPDDLRGYSPLSIPLLCGWNRQLCKYPKGKKITLYQAPCGVRLRNMEELHQYLRRTGSPMSVDLFDFDYWVHCLAEFVLDKCFINIKDLSYGVENVPIPCVNELDHTQPDTIRYSTQREPTEGVNLNLDPDFLCSCDCEDDCQDKTKCQCWQLTIQGATLGGRVPNTAVGYVYKRLPEPVTTGIYECNSRCKCAVKTCLNRVVQHPLTLKLQVFKTAPRGWGIRCLNDIPLGSFICIYAGRLLTEQGANEGGKNYGDEYLAELDYVEVVEGIKEGYESDVLEPEMPLSTPEDKNKLLTSEDEDTSKTNADSDEDFNISKYVNFNVDSAGPSSIRKRLRKRKRDDGNQDGSEENSEDGSGIKIPDSTSKSTNESRSNEDGIIMSDEEETRGGRREPSRFEPTVEPPQINESKFKSVRDFFGEDEAVYIMDAKTTGNIGRYLNHSCDPNIFVQNVFVDTHDVRFPWVAFFALNYIRAGQELTWNYSYDVGSIPGKVIICKCGASNCRGRLL